MEILQKNMLSGFFNDEENPIVNIDEDIIYGILENREIDFENAYYSLKCEECGGMKVENERAYKFLEYHFYIYTKNNEYVTNSLDVEEEGLTFNKLQIQGKVDNSYIVSIIVCAECKTFTIEVEEFEI